jgi:hypothetical protein
MITFADNKNGTGGTFTISGGDPAAIHTIYVSRFHGSNASRVFAPAGSRTGNGAVAFNGENGAYIAHQVTNNAGLLSFGTPVCFQITDGTDSLYWRFVAGIREFILSLALPGVATDPDQHFISKIGSDLERILQNGVNSECVYYIPTGEKYAGSDNAYDSVSLPVNVIFITKGGHQNLQGELRNLMLTRETVNTAIPAVPVPDVGEIHSVDVEPGPIIEPGRWAQGYDVSVVRLIGHSEQTDGIL